MRALEHRINRLDGLLICRKVYFVVSAYKRQEEAKAEERRRKADEERAAVQAEWQARRAADEARRKAEESARTALPPVEPHVELPAAPAPVEPKTPPWTYETPPEMQIRPVFWRRSEPYDDGSEDNYGKCIVDYDPLAEEDDDYYDD